MRTNCYFLTADDGKSAAIVDPGDDADKIIEKVKQKELCVKFILLTHGHFDHTMALEGVRDALNVPVFIHEFDNELLLDGKKSMLNVFSNKTVVHRPAEKLLSDGDEIALGDEKIKVLHTPGHTKGSCCFVCGDFLITGDTLFDGAAGRYDFYGGDFSALICSIERIRDLEGDFKIYPGHGNSSYLSTERINNPYMQY